MKKRFNDICGKMSLCSDKLCNNGFVTAVNEYLS
jgi:hypothetical protein